MKNKTIKRTILAGLAGLVAAAGGCSEFNGVFRPSRISSTYKERNIFALGQKIEGMVNGDQPYYVDAETHTLYVHAKNYHKTLEQFGLKENGSFNELFEGVRVEVKYKNPQTGEIVDDEQIVANDGTIDTLELGSFNAFKTRQRLDEEITKAARIKYDKVDMQVTVEQKAYPYADQPRPFLGFASLINAKDATITQISSYPMSFSGALVAGGMGDTKYSVLIKTKNTSNLNKVGSIDSPDYVRRIMVFGETGALVTGAYEKIGLGHEDVVIGLSNRPLDNFQAFLGELGDTLDLTSRLSGGFMTNRTNLDLIGHDSLYIPSKMQTKTSKLGKFTVEANEFNNAIDASRGLRDRLQGN